MYTRQQTAVFGAQAQPLNIKRIELQRQDLIVPGREAVQVHVELDRGAGFGRHKHPGNESSM